MASNSVEVFLRLIGARVFQSEAAASAKSLQSIDKAADGASARTSRFDSALTRAGGALAAVGRGATLAGAAIGIAGAAGVGFGLKFNATMEQNEVAFTNFLGSAGKARAYLNDLYKISATTPFEFPELTGAARRFLAFGFSAQKTKDLLLTVGDAVAGIGGGAAEIDRVTMALGQIQAKGKLSTEELLQLAELGIPAFEILRKQLGLTGAELETKLRQGAIGADQAIGALQRGMNEKFKGMAAAQSKTFLGQLSTMKDNAMQGLGELSEPLFNLLRDKVLPGINAALPGIVEGAKRAGGGIMAGITGGLAPGGKAGRIGQGIGKFLKSAFDVAKGAVTDLLDALKPAMPFISNVILPLLKGIGIGVIASIVGTFKIAIPIIKILASVIGFVGKLMAPFKGVITAIGVAIGFVFSPAILGKVGALFKVMGGGFKVVGAVVASAGKVIGFVGKIFMAFGRVAFFVVRAYARVVAFLVGKLFGALRKVGGILAGAGRAFGRFATAAWNAIKSGVGKIFNFLKSIGSKLFKAGKTIWTKIVDGLKSAIGAGAAFAADLGKSVANAVIGFLNSAIPNKIPIPGAPDISLPDDPIPRLARGGVVRSTGLAIVGERGPELLTLPGGSRVTPMAPPTISMAGVGGGGGERPIVVQSYLDGRLVAESVARRAADKRAAR